MRVHQQKQKQQAAEFCFRSDGLRQHIDVSTIVDLHLSHMELKMYKIRSISSMFWLKIEKQKCKSEDLSGDIDASS